MAEDAFAGLMFAVPRYDNESLPESERRAAGVLINNLFAVQMHASSFADAVALFRDCRLRAQTFDLDAIFKSGSSAERRALQEQHSLLHRWTTLAARDGAMSIYHFAKAMEAGTDFSGCPSLGATVDHKALRLVRKLFASRFPHFLPMRHALAHKAELTGSVQQIDENSIKGDFDNFGVRIEGGGGMIIDHLFNDTFATTFEGQVLSYDVTPQTHANLEDIARRLYATFPKPPEPERRPRLRPNRPEPPERPDGV